jgi:methylated-DNA-[protein]-cysteine S-methyltransferase
MSSQNPLQVVAFPTELGWMAVLGAGSAVKPTVKQLVFGHASKAAALAALDPTLLAQAAPGDWYPALVERLREYAEGMVTDFRDVEVDLDHLTAFQHRVMKHCRAIGYGDTRSYGELAAASGSARAARAVGNTMAGNRVPLIVPCHRVINSDGTTGAFSSPDGPAMKVRLLAMESRGGVAVVPPKRAAKTRIKSLTAS